MTQHLETTASILVSNRMELTAAFVQVDTKSLIQLNVMVGFSYHIQTNKFTVHSMKVFQNDIS